MVKFNKKTIEFMKRCAKSNYSYSKTLEKTKNEFKILISKKDFSEQARINGIHFMRGNGFDLNEVDKTRLKIIKENKYLPVHIIRDKLIEQTKEAIYNTTQIRIILHKLLVKELNEKGIISPVFSYEVDRLIQDNYEFIKIEGLRKIIKKETEKTYKLDEIRNRIVELNTLSIRADKRKI